MKILFFLLVSALTLTAAPLFPVVPTKKPIRLQWDPSPSTNVVNYRLYHATNDLGWTSNEVGNVTTVRLNVLFGSTNWFMVTAINTSDVESVPSNVLEVAADSQPEAPGALRIVPLIVSIQTRAERGEWTELRKFRTNYLIPTNEVMGEFRALVQIDSAMEVVR